MRESIRRRSRSPCYPDPHCGRKEKGPRLFCFGIRAGEGAGRAIFSTVARGSAEDGGRRTMTTKRPSWIRNALLAGGLAVAAWPAAAAEVTPERLIHADK